MSAVSLFATYLRQQSDSGVDEFIFSAGFARRTRPAPVSGSMVREPAVGPMRTTESVSAFRIALPAQPKVAQQAGARARPLSSLANFDILTPGEVKPDKRELLKQVYYEFKVCHQCPLGKSRKHFVFGAGSVEAPLFVIGEAPGNEENLEGMPLVGKAGRLLTDMLAAIRIDRQKQTFVTNVLKCHPPENRNPHAEEISACLPLLERQIGIIKPKAMLFLGATAAHALLKRSEPIQTLREQAHMYLDIPVVVTYHPAALLHHPPYKRPAWEDLQKLQKILTECGVYAE